MHFQVGNGMAKLVRCAQGAIVDVVVDLRKGSPTFGQWEAYELNDENLHQIYCPIGFAHGFVVTGESADVIYKCSTYYDEAIERGIKYDDPDVGIAWPAGIELQPSERDAAAPLLREVEDDLPFKYDG
jgi:dTDP-4-dehydrorhamnose 3,5-epimerase